MTDFNPSPFAWARWKADAVDIAHSAEVRIGCLKPVEDGDWFSVHARFSDAAPLPAGARAGDGNAAESPCQFAIDNGGNLYRRYREPVCAGCVPVMKLTDKWESCRVADFNAGWNACRDAMLAAAPAVSAPATALAVVTTVFELCEGVEDKATPSDAKEYERGFKAGERFAAKHIRTAMGVWAWDEGITSRQQERNELTEVCNRAKAIVDREPRHSSETLYALLSKEFAEAPDEFISRAVAAALESPSPGAAQAAPASPSTSAST